MKVKNICNRIIKESSGKLKNILEAIEKSNGLEETEEMVRESSIGRVWSHIENPDSTFVMISASRSENSKEKNDELYSGLKDIARNKLKLGYIELVGGYVETTEGGGEVEVTEKSLLIPKISKEDAIYYGVELKQESILYKDSTGMETISTKTYTDKELAELKKLGKRAIPVGTVLDKFKSQAGRDNFAVSKKAVEKYFSELNKKKFAFNIKEDIIEENIFVFEREPHQLFTMVHTQGKPKWKNWSNVFHRWKD